MGYDDRGPEVFTMTLVMLVLAAVYDNEIGLQIGGHEKGYFG